MRGRAAQVLNGQLQVAAAIHTHSREQGRSQDIISGGASLCQSFIWGGT